MKFLKKMLGRTGGLVQQVKRLRVTRLVIPATPAVRDLVRAAMAGMILFAIAGAGMGARGGFKAFKVDAASAGATVSVGWGYAWLTWAAAGMGAGAFAGAVSGYLASLYSRERGGAFALLSVGVVGGVLAGATWGGAVARERVVQVRAQPTSAAPLTPKDGATVSIVTGPIRLSGRADRDVNVPLFAFMLLGGSIVGALAARGLSSSVPFEHVENPQDRGFVPGPTKPVTRQNRAHAGAV